MSKNRPLLAVLVCSSDGYEDAWKPFFTLFFRFWHDCPYPVYLATNHKRSSFDGVTTIAGGKEDWSANLKKVLHQIGEAYILLLLEDYLIRRAVDQRKIEALFSFVRDHDIAHLRLLPMPPPDAPFDGHPDLGQLSREAPYRASIQAGIWKREVLSALLREGESPWQFEIEGTRRARKLPEVFLCLKRESELPLDYFCTGIIRGKWVRGALALLRKEGIEPDLRRRPPETWGEVFKRYLDAHVIRKEWWIWAAKRMAGRLGLTKRSPAASKQQ